jgi:hypothetical protein
MEPPKINKLFFDWLLTIIINNLDCYKDNTTKGMRLRYLHFLFEMNDKEFMEYINNSKSENFNLNTILEFDKESELLEWVISGLSKKDQEVIFKLD